MAPLDMKYCNSKIWQNTSRCNVNYIISDERDRERNNINGFWWMRRDLRTKVSQV